MNTEKQKLEATFSSLIISIASSAIVGMGLEKSPQTGKVEKNKEMAQYSIDLLVLLREKTSGNLSDAEKNYLEAIVQDLQMKFVQTQ